MTKKQGSKRQAVSIEEQYHELFQSHSSLYLSPLNDESTLEQPSPLKVVPSITTYDGAYKEPIVGA